MHVLWTNPNCPFSEVVKQLTERMASKKWESVTKWNVEIEINEDILIIAEEGESIQ